jgi:hypothetical protein
MSVQRVEWDSGKDRTNRLKHGFGFAAVRPLFERDAPCLVFYDEIHSDEEDRFLAIGLVERGVVVVAYAEPAEDVVRVISARDATRHERRLFLEYLRGHR